ncbi:MAG: hypothetical protein Q7T23_06955 [Phenylobacterium sp.]|nr:hypothetical protein [Phenylobacterium sp.]
MDDLFHVGATKHVGYLPIRTVEASGWTVPDTVAHLEASGLEVFVLSNSECSTATGSVYAWDRAAVQRLLDLNRPIVQGAGWPLEADLFVREIWTSTAAFDTPLYELIGVLFSDVRMAEPVWVRLISAP